jgi:hypothetical protein
VRASITSQKISYGWLNAVGPRIEQLFEGQPEEGLIQAGSDSVAVSRVMFGGTAKSSLFANSIGGNV